MNQNFSRRAFLGGLVVAAGAGVKEGRLLKGQAAGSASLGPVCVFSKHLQWLGYDEMAGFAASVGFDGIDLTVRPGGHVEPERVETDLPRAARAVRDAGLKLEMMTTAINDPKDPLTTRVLRTASENGVRLYRMGYYRFEDSIPVTRTLDAVADKLRGLAELNEKYQICGDYQNHAGTNYFGGSIWDLWTASRGLGEMWIGCQFDLRHATVEGAMTWPVDFRLIASRCHSVVMKDFRWENAENRSQVVNCALGQGDADFSAFLDLVKVERVRGPVSVHFEYPLGGIENGSREVRIPRQAIEEAMRRDLAVARTWLQEKNLA